jgi:benzylsuccinate CoA-transferase BbsF subunit
VTTLPLKGLRVINFGWVWAAPVLGHTLGDMGAEVIKVETRKRPDLTRMLPKTMHDLPRESLYSHTTFRNQLGVTIDLATPKGAELARDLIRSADVVIENFSPRVMRGYGLTYETIRELRPDVVMISLSAAGQTGPLSEITTFGSIIGSMSGLHAHQGYIGREKPSRYGTSIPDPIMGVLGAFAVLAALRYRAKTGFGQYVDLSQWEACATLLGGPLMDSILNQRIQLPRGNRDEVMAPHGVYPCRGDDLWVTIAVKTEEEWRALCEAMGTPELADDIRFGDPLRRHMNHDAMDDIIGAWTATQVNYDVASALQSRGIAAFPSLNDVEVFEDEHLKARGDWVEVEHRLGNEVIYGVPWKLSKTPGSVRRAAPVMGQDNQQVFGGLLGLPEAEVSALEEAQVLY